VQRSGLPYEWHAIEQSFSSGAQQELDRLQSLREPPLPPPPARADQPAAADGLAAPEARDALAAPVVPQPDPRDEEITVLQFRLRDRARSDFHRSVAVAAAFVHNPANELLPVPVVREFLVSPIPGVHRPETASPAPPVRPLVKVRWNEDQVARFRLVRPVAAPSCVPLPVAAPPPWAAPPWAGLPAGAQQP
jgi:hypothetical protein